MSGDTRGSDAGRAWPLAIGLGLLVVVAVNLGFAWIAAHHAPVVEPSYERTERR